MDEKEESTEGRINEGGCAHHCKEDAELRIHADNVAISEYEL